MVADADGAAGQYTSSIQHYIDHRTSLAQCDSAWKDPQQDPAWPPAAIPMQSHLLWSLDGGTSVRGLFAPMRISDLDGVMETTCDRDPIKTAMEESQARERERYQRQTAFAAYRMSGKSSYKV